MALLAGVLDRGFAWATGIEDTFITAVEPRTGRTLDEYALTGHYERWQEDIRLIAALGVRHARYGVPWHRVNPARGRWDWDWAKRALDALLEAGVDPIVDLVHYGTPAWLEGAFLNPDFPARMAEYAARLAEKFKGRIRLYTPLNEPRITAWYCGRLGWWPPYRKGWRGFVEVMLAVCRGIVQTCEALRSIDPDITLVHVDATDLYRAAEATLEAEAARRQEIVFLALDLVSGRIDASHPLYRWLVEKGTSEETLAWFGEHAVDLDIVGLNLYPMYTNKVLVRSRLGLRIRMPYGTGEIIERLGEMYWEHSRRPLMITETAAVGPVARRRRWLEDSIRAVRNLRARGIPMIGYTWWPLFSLVGWAYRQGAKDIREYLLNMGLWDLDPENLNRIATPLVEEYRSLVEEGEAAVGKLMKEDNRT